MDASWLHRYHLIGNEDCGVGIECRDHFDGGRPLAYYDRTGSKSLDPAVQNVSTIAGLLAAAEAHEQEKHGGAVAQVTKTAQALMSGVIRERELIRLVQAGLRDQ